MPCDDMLPITAVATYTSNTAGASAQTPLLYTLQGARHAARIEKAANPSRTVVIVLVTDADEVGGTHPCSADLQGEVEAARNDDHVYTAVVGIGIASGSAPEAQANDIAFWGGTGAAIFLPGGGDPASLNQAMQDIRNSFACSRSIPNPLPDGVTLDDIEVTLNIGGAPTVITDEVTDASDCDAGETDQFYFVSADELVLCSDTCGAVTAGSNFEINVPCGPQVVTVSGADTFGVPEGTCPQGSFPKWTQMIANGSFPGGSSITVEAHTMFYAADAPTWPSLEWVPITTLNDSSTNPINLFGPLDGFNGPPAPERDPALTPPQGYGEFIEFRFNSTLGSIPNPIPLLPPITVAPTLGDYEVQFTCEFTE